MGPPAGSPGRPLSTAPLAHRCPPLPVAACLLLRDYHCLTLLATATHHCLSPTTAEPTARSQRTRPTGPPPVPGHLLDPGIRPHRSPHPAISPCTWRRRRHRRRTFRMRTASSQRRRRPDTSRSPRIAVLTTKVRPQSASNRPASTMTDLRPDDAPPTRADDATTAQTQGRRTTPSSTASNNAEADCGFYNQASEGEERSCGLVSAESAASSPLREPHTCFRPAGHR